MDEKPGTERMGMTLTPERNELLGRISRGEVFDLRVTRAATKEIAEGVSTTATLSGRGRELGEALTGAIGHGISLETAGGRKLLAALRRVVVKEGKDGVPGVAATVHGPRELDGLVGTQVSLWDAEPELKGLRQAVERLRPKPGEGVDSVEVTGPDGEGFRLEAGKKTVDRVTRKRGRDGGAP